MPICSLVKNSRAQEEGNKEWRNVYDEDEGALRRIKNISKEKELSVHTEDLDSLHEIMCQLPDELIDQILIRLPEESLLRFKSVSHAWNAKINSPSFVKSYGECKYSSMKVMLHTCDGELPIYSFSVNCREPEEQAVENIPHNFGSYDYKVVGSCDGLLLVEVKTPYRLWIWNPSTRQYIDLPLSNYSRMKEFYFPRYGFGCVNSSGERNYKVIIIYASNESKIFVIYSTFKKSWRRIEDDVPYGISCNSLALVNAKLHFHARDLNHEDVILAFDLEDEEFKELPGPNCESITSILELNGRLCIIASCGDDHGVHKKMNVWVMKEYGVQDSWTNMFCIDITNMMYLGDSCCRARPLHFYVDGKILLHASYEIVIEDMDSDSDQSQSETEKKLLVYYDSKNQTAIIPNQHALPNIFRSKTYVETLISPNSISPCQ